MNRRTRCATSHLLAGQAGARIFSQAATSWTNIGLSGDEISSLTYDSSGDLLYAGTENSGGTAGTGVWVYNGTNWTNTGGGVSSAQIDSFAYDSVHNVLYAGTDDSYDGIWKYKSHW